MKQEWDWMDYQKEEKGLKNKTQQQYDDYYSRKSQGDSMKVIFWAGLVLACFGFWYFLFNGIFG